MDRKNNSDEIKYVLVTFGLAIVFLLTWTGCGRLPQQSVSKSIVGSLNLTLVHDTNQRTIPEQAMGSLQVILSDPNEENSLFSIPYCSAFRIARDKILTAAHCSRDHLIFNPRHLAKTETFKIINAGSELRLSFDGSLIENANAFVQEKLKIKLLWSDVNIDAAIYQLPEEVAGPFIDITQPSNLMAPAALLGYPNGIPLAKSENCSAFMDSEGFYRHNCSALGGSSGGLLLTSDNRPIALHQQGVGKNSYAFYQEHSRFETSDEFATRSGCDLNDKACVTKTGWNRAMPLSTIAERIKNLDFQSP